MTEYEKMKAGLLYNCFDEELADKRLKVRKLLEEFNRLTMDEEDRKQEILDEVLNSHGKNTWIEPPLRMDYGCHTSVGDNFYMNFDGIILDVCDVTIGDNVLIGPRVSIVPPMHPLVAEERKTRVVNGKYKDSEYGKPIVIGNNVWIATGAIICGGVTIGDDVVIGAGSVVTRDIPSGYVAYGNPCKPRRKITDADRMFAAQGIKE